MNFDLRFYWKLVLRRLPAMAALFLFCAGVGVALAVKLPTTYASAAKLLVENAQISPELARTTVQTSSAEQLQIIQQRLLTRANLIDIANQLNVFADTPGMSPDQVVREMRQRTSMRSSGQPLLMTISFKASRPRVAANVVNEYVTLILAANAEFRTGVAGTTLDFFEDEVDRLNTELDLQSERILAFKNANANALPDNLNFRLGRQSMLQERVSRAERDRAELIDQRERIVTLYETTGRLRPPNDADLSPEQRQLNQLESDLNNALIIYSPTNPRVRVLQTRIAQLEEIVRAQTTNNSNEISEADTQASLFEINIAEIDGRITALDQQITETNSEMAELEETLKQTPQNNIALQALERDAGNIRSQYNGAVGRLAQARMGERIELSPQGQRITVVEPANIPGSPASPNRPVIAGGGIGAGLAAAAGLFLLLEITNRSVRRPAEITSRLGITPLATIPYIESKGRRRLRITARAFVLLCVLIGVPAILWALDTYYLPLDLLFERLVDRLGLG